MDQTDATLTVLEIILGLGFGFSVILFLKGLLGR